MSDAPDFAMCIGADNYGKAGAGFKKEAETLGISRRLNQIPKGLVPGKSKVYCIYGAGHDSMPRNCPKCSTPYPQPVDEDDPPVMECPTCKTARPVTKRKAGEIGDYFTVDRIEVVLRCTESAARSAVQMAKAFGLFDCTLEDTPEVLRASLTIKDEKVREALESIRQNCNIELDADLIAPALNRNGASIIMVAKEPKRLCGFRHHAKTYAVTSMGRTNNESPLREVPPEVIYRGPHFRGLKQLAQDEADVLDVHVKMASPAHVEIEGKPVVPERGQLALIEE